MKIKYFFIVCYLIIGLTACSREKDKEENINQYINSGENDEEENINQYIYMNPQLQQFFSSQGYLYTGGQHPNADIEYFYDPQTKLSVPLCSKPNCKHQGTSSANPHPTCDGYFGAVAGASCFAVVGDSLYYVTSDADKGDWFTKHLCKANVDGTNRVVLQAFEQVEYCNYAAIENQYMIYVYHNADDEKGSKLDKRRPGICLYNMETGAYEQIVLPDGYEALCGMASLVGNSLYYFYSYSSQNLEQYSFEELGSPEIAKKISEGMKLELWRYDLETKEQILVDSDVKGDNASLSYGRLFTRDSDGSTNVKNLATGETFSLDKDIAKGKEVCSCPEGYIFLGDGDIYLFSVEKGQMERTGTYDKNRKVSLEYISEQWVYLSPETEVSIFCLPKDKFMKGEWEWDTVPQK